MQGTKTYQIFPYCNKEIQKNLQPCLVLIELAAVMASDKVSRKAAKASKAFSNLI
jgi:hypothetical protein